MVILYNSTVNILHIGLLGSTRRDKQPVTLKFMPMDNAELSNNLTYTASDGLWKEVEGSGKNSCRQRDNMQIPHKGPRPELNPQPSWCEGDHASHCTTMPLQTAFNKLF